MALKDLQQNEMMAHLLDGLKHKRDIGHYGRLVFAIVARHFVDEDELVKLLAQDKDFSKEQASGLVQQVQQADYNPPRREKIMEYMQKQDFPILPNADDPDAGNVYRDLEFPESVYQHISEYHQQKAG